MNDDIRLTITDLVTMLSSKQKEFDQWMDEQMKNLQTLKSAQMQNKIQHQKQVDQMIQEKNQITQNIKAIQANQQQCRNKEKNIQIQQNQIMNEIAEIPKEFGIYKSQIYLLETKFNRLRKANVDQIEDEKKKQTILEAYETLFGLTIKNENGTLTFTFSDSAAKIVIAQVSNNYQFIEIPKQLNLYQRVILEKFNQDKSLFNFLAAIRSHL